MSNVRAPKRISSERYACGRARVTSSRFRRGFTLLEAMVGVVILAIGIVGALTSFGTLIRVEDRARQTERMQRLAQDKLAELVATGQAATSSNGDFTEQNEPGYTWNLEVNTSGITDLNAVSLTVTQTGANGSTRLDTLLYVPPVTTETANQ